MNEKTDQRLRFTLRQLEVFTATARTGSTRGAADRVARSQSAASTALADLETALGQQLFDRVGRRLLLNERGRAFLPRAVSMLDGAVDLQALFSEEQPTPLRMAASLTIGEYLLPDIVAAWKQARPRHAVRMTISNTSDVIDAVLQFDADIGFIEGRQTHPDISVKPWLTDELVLIAAPTHPLAGKPASAAQLAAATWVLREPGSGTREASDRWLLEHLAHVDVEFELGSSEAIKRVVASGVGIGCLSRYAVAEALARGTLVELKSKLPREVRALSMVVHRQRSVGSSARAFIEKCLESSPPARFARPPRGRRQRTGGAGSAASA